MNNRQKSLYECLNRQLWYVSQTQIGRELLTDYDDLDCNDYHNSYARQLLTKDIRAINNDTTAEKIIISSRNGIKLATKEEAIKFIENQYKAVFRKLKRIRKLEKKANLNGQFKIIADENGDFVSAFIEN